MLLLIIINCILHIYLIHSICNIYDDTINYIFIYYNWHAINTYSILLIITNNKKVIKCKIYKSGKREHSTFKVSGVFFIHIGIESCICFQSIFISFEVPLVQTWNKKQFCFGWEVCSSNENKGSWFRLPWRTITTAVTLVLSSPRK